MPAAAAAYGAIVLTGLSQWLALLAASSAIVLAVGAYAGITRDLQPLLLAVFVVSAMQNLALGWWLLAATPRKHGHGALAALELKSLLLVVVGGLAILILYMSRTHAATYRPLRRALAPWLLLVLLAAAFTLLRRGSDLATALAYARNFATPGLILSAAAVVGCSAASLSATHVVFKAVGGFVTIGSAGQLAVGQERWDRFVNVAALGDLKGPVSDATDFFGIIVPRLRSFLGEPVNLSYLLSGLFIWAIMTRRHVWAGAFAVQQTLTFGKGGMLLTTVALLWLLLTSRKGNTRGWRRRAAAAVLATPILVAAYASISGSVNAFAVYTDPLALYSGQNSALAHAGGFALGVSAAFTAPLGAGLGAGGNFGDIFQPGLSSQNWISSGAESAVGVIGFQLGLAGLLLVALGAYRVLDGLTTPLPKQHIGAFDERNDLAFELRLATGLFLGWLSASLFQENTFGPQASLVPLILVGVLLGRASRIRSGARITGTLAPMT